MDTISVTPLKIHVCIHEQLLIKVKYLSLENSI
jgi:hypothetical protein